MKNNIKLTGLSAILFMVIVLLGLTGNIQIPVANTNNLHYPKTDQNKPVHLVDGDYLVQTKYYTPEGYRPQMKMSVRNGLITQIQYEESTPMGTEIKDNDAYIQSLKTTVEKYNESRWQNITSIIMHQNPYVLPRVAQEPMHESLFRSLAITCFKNAQIGKKENTEINDFVWTYRARSDEPNVENHFLELIATFNGDTLIKLQTATYDATHHKTTNGFDFGPLVAHHVSQQNIDYLDPIQFPDVEPAFLEQYNDVLLQINNLRNGIPD